MWQKFASSHPEQTQRFSPRESEVWSRLLVALDEGDSETVKLYAVSILITFVMLLFVCCGTCFCCGTFFYALERTCCVCRSLFRVLRRICNFFRNFVLSLFCCCFKRRVSPRREACVYGRRTLDDGKPRAKECRVKRIEARNAGSVKTLTPYCERHWSRECRRHAMETRHFEIKGSKYTFNLRYSNAEVDICKLMRTEVRQARQRQRDGNAIDDLDSAPGFLYVYTSTVDNKAVELRRGDTNQMYFWKIGMTRKKSAKARVDQWKNARFVNKEGVGWWSTRGNSALSAEQLVHALLANARYSRFNDKEDAFEIEWFFVSYEKAKEAIETVVAAGDNYETLQDPRICANFY